MLRVMHIVTAAEARKTLDTLIDKTAETHEPVYITGRRTNGVLVSEDDWVDIQEELFQVKLSRVKEIIRKTAKAPPKKAAKKPIR